MYLYLVWDSKGTNYQRTTATMSWRSPTVSFFLAHESNNMHTNSRLPVFTCMIKRRRAQYAAWGKTTARSNGFVTTISFTTRHPAHSSSRHSDRSLQLAPSWPWPGQHPALIQVAVASRPSQSASSILLLRCPFDPSPLHWLHCPYSPHLRAWWGPVPRNPWSRPDQPQGLVSAELIWPKKTPRGPVQGTFGRGGNYKGSPPSPPRHFRFHRRAETAPPVSWTVWLVIKRVRLTGKLLYLPLNIPSKAQPAFLGCSLWFLADRKLGSYVRKYGVIYLINRHESSFLEYLIRIGLQNDIGGYFPSLVKILNGFLSDWYPVTRNSVENSYHSLSI